MATWSGILAELNEYIKAGKPPSFDAIRRKYLVAAHKHTGRNIILYATKFTQPGGDVPPGLITIVDEDLQGFMEVVHGLKGEKLDLILHSPGGSPTAAESIVAYLRSKFTDIRVIVPQLAMSAATMIACAADRIVMGKHSFLGPIDTQFNLPSPLGARMVPCQAILDQFELAKRECADPTKLGGWMPILPQYGPDLLIQCQNALDLSSDLVEDWLKSYMFAGMRGGAKRAKDVSTWLSNHANFKSHNRHLSRDTLASKGLVIDHLEDDQKEQDLFLSIFHASTHTLTGTQAVKIIENHLGKAFIKMQAIPISGTPVVPVVQPADEPKPKKKRKQQSKKKKKTSR
ncbi:MAG: serine protease [Planctomycetes bacterium]|nr:serine protease [Planctomycetota bacterium]